MLPASRPAPALVLAALAFAAGIGLLSERLVPVSAEENDDFAAVVRPLLERHCLVCHAGSAAQGRLDLQEHLASESLAANAGTWRRVAERLRQGEMPPVGQPRPPRSEIDAALAWLDAHLAPARSPAASHRRGRVTARRLNRVEYENTVRDLFGATWRAGETFPADDVGYGFDNVGDVLSLPPVLLEKYLLAAEAIAAEAVPDDDPEEPSVRTRRGDALEGRGGGRLGPDDAWVLFSRAEVDSGFDLPRDGVYVIRAEAQAQQAGPDKARMAFLVDGRAVDTVEIIAEAPDTETHEIRRALVGGPHRIGVAFLNDYYKPDDPDPSQRDRNLVVVGVEVVGPVDERVRPPSRPVILPARNDVPGFRRALAGLARRVWRGSVTGKEVDRLLTLVGEASPEGATPAYRMRVALTALLVSPRFLFRLEPDVSDGAPDRPLEPPEMASRLSYFLWSSTPDERLLDLADAGRLADRAVLDVEVDRMLADARASALAENFAPQWLAIRDLRERTPDAQLFPHATGELLEAMERETILLFETVLRENRDVRTLLDADFTFVNEALAKHYGLPGVRGAAMRRVPLPAGERGGILTHASILTATSNPTRTSPVKRGKWILETLLDAAPPPPPPGVGVIDESPKAAKAASLRQRLRIHREDPSCAACHDRMDPLGFALEHYDAVGSWRARDGEHLIDPTGTLPDGRALDGVVGLKQLLLEEPAFPRALSKALLVYALGRGLTHGDDEAVRRLTRALDAQPTLRNLIHEIVRLPAFSRRTLARPENQADGTKPEDEA